MSVTTESASGTSGNSARQRMRLLPLISLLAAHGLSLAGNAVTIVVVPLYVLHDTGSVLATGVAGVFATVPIIVGGPLGGVLVDRVGFRRAAIIADLASGATVLAIPLLAATVGLPFWALLALVFLSGLLDTPGNTAKEAIVPDLAELCDVKLTRVTGAAGAISRSATMVGASVAAIAVVWLGPLNALLLDAVTFALSAALIWGGVPKAVTGTAVDSDAAPQVAGGFWREFADGIRYIARTPVIRSVVLMLVITNCFDAAGILVLKPVYAKTITPDGAIYGIMLACFAFGALSGSGLYGWIGHRLPRRATFIVCFVLCGPPPYIAMALDVPVPLLLAVFAFSGLLAGSINPLLDTVLYEQLPRTMRARVLGTLIAGTTAGMPVGAMLGGVTVEAFDLVPVLIFIAIAYGLIALAPLVGKSWKGLDAASGGATLPRTVRA